MPEALICPHCRGTVGVPDHLLGGNISCPYCRGVFLAAMSLPDEPEPVPGPENAPFDFDGNSPVGGLRPQPRAEGPAGDLSRNYRHSRCGAVTTVSGDDYVRLECAFRPVEATFCAGCRKFFPLVAFQWDDTDENIERYRSRVYYSVPLTRRIYLTAMANAYEGAIMLNLDKHGRPLPRGGEEFEDEE